MELFFCDVSFQATLADIRRVFADQLHSPHYLPQSGQLWNFHIKLFPPRRNRSGQAHGGCGKVTVPEEYLGLCLLQDFGGNSRRLSIAGRKFQLKTSKDAPNPTILEKIRREPYVPPEVEQRIAEIHESFQQNTVGVQTLQLGWETRGGVFSIEWEKDFPADSLLSFSDKRRELRIRHIDQPNIVRSIVIPWSQISWSATYYADEGHPAIFLSLYSPPIFDIENTIQTLIQSILGPQIAAPAKRQRVLVLYPDDADLIRVLPYTTLSIRILCRRVGDMKTFRTLCKTAHLSAPKDYRYHAEYLELFSETKLEQYRQWTSTLDWSVAFQLESLLRGRIADAKEILSIRRIIDHMLVHKGADHTANFLRSVAHDTSFDVQGVDEGAFADTIKHYANEFSWSPHPWGPNDGIFNCLHVYISPTSMTLGGPYPERSNRVLRTYADNYDSFIRVSFVEETELRYQQDREIDGPGFIGRWVSPILHDGLIIAGRRFQFLAYSQSALKTHTVWFVKNFQDREGNLITAATIIDRLGTFHDLDYDPGLVYCPARYAARIAQAFTTTDSSVSVTAEEIFIEDDIEDLDGKYCFTDGVGSMSPQIARKIWRAFQKRRSRSTRRALTYSRAFQIRLGGAKGMLSVDHRLQGDVVVLRPSMIKFDAPHSTDVEIAQAFVRPSKYYLNRPLIMVLEGLGIGYEVFERLQDAAVRDVNDAVLSLENAVKTLDQFGLASSYRLSSTLLHLAKLDITPSDMGDFYDRMIEITIHHILRDLKHHARIPVDEGYTLVGVADIHGYLQEGEIFACVTTPETGLIHYLEGDVLVSRSPIIHPGDVQVVCAIGPPPIGSPFEKESLVNTIVFSVKGTRPLSSCLGGGDLDGDVYNVTSLKELHPSQNIPPAAYEPAPRKLLPHPSTMDDVADFVADYINSDILGMVAINWLLIADLNSIFHEDCLSLCQVHSDAVDYPKNGTPVSLGRVPKPKSDRKPDWHAPETVDLDSSNSLTQFYQSQKAIGKLFRAIDLPEVRMDVRAARRKRHQVREDQPEADLDEVFAALCMNDREGDPLESAVKNRVAEFILVDDPDSEYVKLAIESLERYSIELQSICACNAIQRHKTATLSEEEAVVGTIISKCSQRRRRKDAMSQLREQTSFLVKGVRDELSGDDDSSLYDWLATAWTAWKVSRQLKDRFGAHSYGWIALGEVFDSMRAIEQDK